MTNKSIWTCNPICINSNAIGQPGNVLQSLYVRLVDLVKVTANAGLDNEIV